jgi:hypothetical protein
MNNQNPIVVRDKECLEVLISTMHFLQSNSTEMSDKCERSLLKTTKLNFGISE